MFNFLKAVYLSLSQEFEKSKIRRSQLEKPAGSAGECATEVLCASALC